MAETPDQRLDRIVADILAGRRTFDQIRASVDRIAGTAPQGGNGAAGDQAAMAGGEAEVRRRVEAIFNNRGVNLASDDPVEHTARSRYPQFSWLLDHPEIGPLLRQAAERGWDPITLQGAIVETEWWKKTAQAQRAWDTLVANDPAEANRRLQTRTIEVRAVAARLGVELDGEKARYLAETWLKFGWSDVEAQRAIGNQLAFDAERPEGLGNVAENINKVKATAADYMVHDGGDEAVWEWGRKLTQGDVSEADMVNHFKGMAASRWNHLAERLDQGFTMRSIVAPMRQMVASELEIDPESINFLDDPRFAQILGVPDEKSGQRMMTHNEALSYVRGLDEWKYTRKANQSAADWTVGLLEMFGKADF